MKFKLIIRPEAELELLEAVKYYEKEIKGLGSSFLLNVEATIETILRIPEGHTPIYKNTRRALVRKFPFGIHYIIEKENIIVLAVFHAKRNPRKLKKRLS